MFFLINFFEINLILVLLKQNNWKKIFLFNLDLIKCCKQNFLFFWNFKLLIINKKTILKQNLIKKKEKIRPKKSI